MVADCRAATPTAAAMLVVASAEEMKDRLHGLQRRLAGATRLTLLRLRAGSCRQLPARWGCTSPGATTCNARCRRRMTWPAGWPAAGPPAGERPRATPAPLLTTRLSPRSLMVGLAHQRQRLVAMDVALREQPETAAWSGPGNGWPCPAAGSRVCLRWRCWDGAMPWPGTGAAAEVLREARQVQAGDEAGPPPVAGSACGRTVQG